MWRNRASEDTRQPDMAHPGRLKGEMTDPEKKASGPQPELDPVEEAGQQSFPASDPPSWTLGVRDREEPSESGTGSGTGTADEEED